MGWWRSSMASSATVSAARPAVWAQQQQAENQALRSSALCARLPASSGSTEWLISHCNSCERHLKRAGFSLQAPRTGMVPPMLFLPAAWLSEEIRSADTSSLQIMMLVSQSLLGPTVHRQGSRRTSALPILSSCTTLSKGRQHGAWGCRQRTSSGYVV
jgi:hypothetical protein